VRIWEGLGNQLFQYAFAKGLLNRFPGDVYLDISSSYRKYLRKKESNIIRPYMLDEFNINIPIIEVETLPEWRFIRQSNLYEKILYKKSISKKYKYQFITDSYDVTEYNPSFYYTYENVYYMGWYQNEKYFERVKIELIKDLTLKKDICIPKIIDDSENVVSIHVRRGDFVKGGWCVSEDYYKEAINCIKKYIKNPIFVVFSDDVEWVKNKMFKENVYFVKDFGNYNACEEMIIMSMCKHNIIANSTYSWWGAWLNRNENKIVISPKTWTPRQKNPNCSNWISI